MSASPMSDGGAEADAPVPDRAAALGHLRLLWPQALPEPGLVTVWGKRTGTRQHLDLAAAAEDLCSVPDRYLTCAAMRAVERGRRGTAAEVVALPGFWGDFDTLGGAHANQSLPTDEQLAEFLAGLAIKPSAEIMSGGGRYGWWLFEVPLVIASEADHRRARELSGAFQAYYIALGRERSWTIDKTADLARCLRAAGSLNGKYTPARLVQFSGPFENAVRYPIEEFEQFLKRKARRKAIFAATPGPGTANAVTPLWLHRVAELLGGYTKELDVDGNVVAIVLETCPACSGIEQAGTVVKGSAHVCRKSGVLKCKRAGCLASESREGMPPERWIPRYVSAECVSEVRTLWAQDPEARPWFTDDGNATRFVRRHGEGVRWCDAHGWLNWSGTRWQVESDVRSLDYARDTARAIVAEAVGIEDPEERDRVFAFAATSQQASRLKAMLELARCELQVRADQLDQNLWTLNVENGQLDLRTGELRPHDPKAMCTKLADARYDPSATCEPLDRFLEAATGGDSDFLDCVERLLGYTLPGEQVEDVVALLLGPGNTGKTTLLEALFGTLGDYSAAIPFDVLLERKGSRAGPNPELLKLRGARFAKAVEVAEGAAFDVAILKSIAGGDTLSARDLFRRPVQFRPQCTLWLAANHAPSIDKDDTASRRRLRILPFNHVVDDDLIAKDLRVRLQAPDARSALLARAVRGCLRWREHGLGTCHVMERAATSYWEGQQTAELLPRFFAAECVVAPDAWTDTASIRARLEWFARNAAKRCPGDKALAGFLRASKCQDARRATARGWQGLRLVPRAQESRPSPGAPGEDGDDAMTRMTPVESTSSTHTHARAHARAHAHTHTRTHAHMGGVAQTRHGVTGVIDQPAEDPPKGVGEV